MSQGAAQLKETVVAVNAVAAERKRIDAKLAEIEKALAAGAGNADDIDFNLDRLRVLEKEIAKAVGRGQTTMGSIRELQTDEAFLATFGAKMAPLVDVASKTLKAITAQFSKVKQLEQQALKDERAASDDADRARQRLAGLVDRVARDKDDLKKLLAKAEAANTSATQAAEQRNATALKKAQAALGALGIDVALFMHRGIAKDIDAFAKEAAGPPLAAIAAELKGGIADVRADLKGSDVYAQVLQQELDRVPALAIAPADLAKAAKVLAIDRAGEKALGEALKLDLKQMEIKLSAIGAQQSPKTTGKAMIAKLTQSGVL